MFRLAASIAVARLALRPTAAAAAAASPHISALVPRAAATLHTQAALRASPPAKAAVVETEESVDFESPEEYVRFFSSALGKEFGKGGAAASEEQVRRVFHTDLASQMEINKLSMKKAMTSEQRHPTDTGSPEAQVSMITARVKYLMEHMKLHPKDYHNRRGLLALVQQRRKLLQYLKRKDLTRYNDILKSLNIRPVAGTR